MRPAPLIACVLSAIAVLALAPVERASAETGEEIRLRELAGQAPGDTGAVRALLARGINPNTQDSAGRTAVHAAAGIGATETLRVLLEAGGSPGVRDRDGNTPLHLASHAPSSVQRVPEYISSIAVLLSGGADARSVNAEGRTPLHLATASHDEPGGVEALLNAGADPNLRDRYGDTSLHAAVGPNLGWPGVVGVLLDGGADPEVVNGEGLSALQLLVREAPDRGGSVTLLLEKGANPDRKYPGGETPLHAAVRSGDDGGKVSVIEALLSGGADPCMRDADELIPYQVSPAGGAIRRALVRASGHLRVCNQRWEQERSSAVVPKRLMEARTLSNIRIGPGLEHDRIGLLEPGELVRVIGEAGDWLRVVAPQGGDAFVFAALLVTPESLVPDGSECTGREEGAECWIEVDGQPGCHVWTSQFDPGAVVRWSGSCVSGVAHGEGTLIWLTAAGASREQTGALQFGRQEEGHWVQRENDGTVIDWHLAGGKLNGSFSARYGSGVVSSACTADDLEPGYCREQPIAEAGSMSNDRRTGRWTEWICYVCQNDDRQVHTVFREEGSYEGGDKHGHWVETTLSGALAGDVDEGPYDRGKRHGEWVQRHQMNLWDTDGYAAIWEGSYRDGIRTGIWTVRTNDGEVEDGPIVHGERHGRWTTRTADGRCFVMEYVQGESVDGSRTEC